MVQHVERVRPPGRNDPCPCGSGKKYKRCCLLQATVCVVTRTTPEIIAEIEAAEADGDIDLALRLLEEAREDRHEVCFETMLVERYLALGPEIAEERLRLWWEQEHDRFSGAGLARLLLTRDDRDEALRVLEGSQ